MDASSSKANVRCPSSLPFFTKEHHEKEKATPNQCKARFRSKGEITANWTTDWTIPAWKPRARLKGLGNVQKKIGRWKALNSGAEQFDQRVSHAGQTRKSPGYKECASICQAESGGRRRSREE